MQTFRMMALAAAAVMAGAIGSAHANLVGNGDFSTTTLTASGFANNADMGPWQTTSGYSFIFFPNGSSTTMSSATTATAATNGVALYADPTLGYLPLSPNGGNFLAQDSSYQTGSLYQQITGLTPGTVYAVSFYQAAGQQQSFTGATNDIWTVSMANTSGGQVTSVAAPTMNVASHGFTSWELETVTFMAFATTELLGFTASSTLGGGQPPFALLDGVTMIAVPEPASVALLGMGLIALAGLRRMAGRRD